MTDKFRQECKNFANANRLGKIEYGDNQVISDSDFLQSLTIEDSCITNGVINGTISSKLSKFTTLDNYQITNNEYDVQIGVKYDDNSTEYIKMGKYLLQDQTNEKTTKTGEFQGLDILSNLNEKYICNITDFTNKTIKELLIDALTQSNIQLATTSFTNDNIPITGNPFTNGETRRDVVNAILKITLNFATIDFDDNKLYLKWLDDEVSETITKDDYSSLEKNNVYGPINCLVLRMSDVEGENVVRQDEQSISINGENQFIIEDDYFLITEDLRNTYIDNLWNKINGFTYVDCKITSATGKPYLKVGNKISVQDDDETYFQTYILKHTFTYDGTFQSVIESPALTKEEEKTKNIQTLKDFKKLTQLKVDKVNQKINAVASSTDENSKKISEVELSLEKMSSTISSTTKTIKDLEDSIDYFSVDLSQYNLTIPTDNSNKPTETKNYDIPFYAYLKGKQITPNVTIQNSYTGITASKTNTYLRFAVSNANSITKELNEYNIIFQFIDGATTYSLTKKINIALAKAGVNGINGKDGIDGKDGVDGKDGYTPVKGKDYFDGENGQDGYTPVKGKDYFDGIDGDDGLSAYEIWLNAGNTGTEVEYLASLKGSQGIQGPAGKDGTSTYFYVKYSVNSNGNPMTNTPSSTSKYMGVASTTSSTAPTSYSAYTWSLIKGADGADGKNGTNGTAGKDGVNGLTSYLHIKYSQDGLTFTEADDEYALGEKPSAWIGQYVDYTEADSTNFDDYKWYKFTEDIDEELNQMQEEIDEANNSASSNYLEIVQLKTDIAQTDEKVDISVQQLSQTIANNNQNLQTEIDNINTNLEQGVETLKNTLVTIDIDGIKVSTNLSKISTIMTNDKFAVQDTTGKYLAYFGYDEEEGRSKAEMDNLTVKNYFTVGYHRVQKYEPNGAKRTGWFYVGGNS